MRLSGTGQKEEEKGGLRVRPHGGRMRERKGALAWRSIEWGQPAAAPGHRARVAPLPHEQGRAAALGEVVTRANVANERDRGEAGPGVNGGLQERAKGRETGWRWGADTWDWAAQLRAAWFKLGLNRNQNSNEMKLISNSFII
jgi:hypothetical protein